MADVFSQFEAKFLLHSKYILFLGDSNVRAQYKDLVWLLNSNTLIPLTTLRKRLEPSFCGDRLMSGSLLHRGRDYKEVRHFYDSNSQTRVDFMFISRCYNDQLEDLFNQMKTNTLEVPDIIVINSCVWDLTRWGPQGVQQYKADLVRLMRLLRQTLPPECLVIWTTTLSAAAHVRGGLLIKQVKCMEPLLRFEIMEANTYARTVVANHGFDLLDYHFYTRMQMHRRAKDGIHYQPIPVRFMTNLLLTHITLSWGRELPHNVESTLLDKAIAKACKPTQRATPSLQSVVKVPAMNLFSKVKLISPAPKKTRSIKVTINPSEGRRCKLLTNEDENTYEEPAQCVRQLVDCTGRKRQLQLGSSDPSCNYGEPQKLSWGLSESDGAQQVPGPSYNPQSGYGQASNGFDNLQSVQWSVYNEAVPNYTWQNYEEHPGPQKWQNNEDYSGSQKRRKGKKSKRRRNRPYYNNRYY